MKRAVAWPDPFVLDYTYYTWEFNIHNSLYSQRGVRRRGVVCCFTPLSTRSAYRPLVVSISLYISFVQIRRLVAWSPVHTLSATFCLAVDTTTLGSTLYAKGADSYTRFADSFARVLWIYVHPGGYSYSIRLEGAI